MLQIIKTICNDVLSNYLIVQIESYVFLYTFTLEFWGVGVLRVLQFYFWCWTMTYWPLNIATNTVHLWTVYFKVKGWYLVGLASMFISRMFFLSISTSSLHNHWTNLCTRSTWNPFWIPTSFACTPLYGCDWPETICRRPSRRKSGSESVSPRQTITPGSRGKKKRGTQRPRRGPRAGCIYRSTRLPLLVFLSSLIGDSARTGEQRALWLWTRERRAAAVIMSCPDVMRPPYGHFAPHAPGTAAFVGSFPVSFLQLLFRNYCWIVVFSPLRLGLLA